MKTTRSLSLLLLLALLLGLASPALAQIPPIDPYRFNVTITFSEETVVAGQKFTVTVSVDTLLAGDLAYHYVWSIGEKVFPSVIGKATEVTSFTEPGIYKLAVTVENVLRNISRTAEKTMKVLPVQPLEAEVRVDREFAVQGEDITATVDVTGGVPPYTYDYTWKSIKDDSPFSTTKNTDRETNSALLPEGLNQYISCIVKVTVRDDFGRSTDGSKTFYVNPYGLSLTSKDSYRAGDTLKVTIRPLGGKPPCQYELNLVIHENNILYNFLEALHGEEVTFSHQLLYGTRGALFVKSTDSDGRRSFVYAEFTITDSPPPVEQLIITNSWINNNNPKGGETLTVTAQVKGGTPPYRIRAEYYAGRIFLGKSEASGLSVPFTVPESGSFDVITRVFDTLGRTTEKITAQNQIITPHPRLAGDANGDGSVDLKDMMQIVNYIKTGTFCTFMLNADADLKDGVDVKDLAYIINHLIK